MHLKMAVSLAAYYFWSLCDSSVDFLSAITSADLASWQQPFGHAPEQTLLTNSDTAVETAAAADWQGHVLDSPVVTATSLCAPTECGQLAAALVEALVEATLLSQQALEASPVLTVAAEQHEPLAASLVVATIALESEQQLSVDTLA
jgi:hypothetical protein